MADLCHLPSELYRPYRSFVDTVVIIANRLHHHSQVQVVHMQFNFTILLYLFAIRCKWNSNNVITMHIATHDFTTMHLYQNWMPENSFRNISTVVSTNVLKWYLIYTAYIYMKLMDAIISCVHHSESRLWACLRYSPSGYKTWRKNKLHHISIDILRV